MLKPSVPFESTPGSLAVVDFRNRLEPKSNVLLRVETVVEDTAVEDRSESPN